MSFPFKFRCWDKIDKKFVTVSAIKFRESDGEPNTVVVDGKEWAVTRFEFDFWTGLRDKNGKEIYEGDVVKNPPPFAGNTIARYTDIVHEAYGSIGYGFETLMCNGEIIGDIRENPEMVK